MDRRVVQVERGFLRVEQRLHISGVETGTDVSGPGCVYALVDAKQGSVAYRRGDARIAAPRLFAVFLPPFAIVQAVLERCDVTSVAVAFRPLASDRLPSHPLLLESAARTTPRSRAEAVEQIQTASRLAEIGRAPGASRLAARAKALIDGNYGAPLEIRGVAARLRASPASVSRRFRASYGIPPVQYRHHVRVMDALLQLAEGAVPVEVFQNVGFDDLSRFYKIFRRVACAAPGSYRPARSRIAKT
jgi:AraC-like DNA-binding protein